MQTNITKNTFKQYYNMIYKIPKTYVGMMSNGNAV